MARSSVKTESPKTIVCHAVAEWAKTLPAWMQKAPRPQGSGAPSAGSNAGQAPLGKNPFAAETFNLTEQSRLYRTDRDLYDRMKAAAQR